MYFSIESIPRNLNCRFTCLSLPISWKYLKGSSCILYIFVYPGLDWDMKDGSRGIYGSENHVEYIQHSLWIDLFLMSLALQLWNPLSHGVSRRHSGFLSTDVFTVGYCKASGGIQIVPTFNRVTKRQATCYLHDAVTWQSSEFL